MRTLHRRGSLVICAALTLAAASSGAGAPERDPLTGEWEGAFVRLNSVQLLTIRLFERDGRLRGSEQIPELLVDDPIEIEVSDPLHVTLKLKYGRFAMLLSEDGYEMTGENPGWGPPVALHLKRASRTPCCLRRDTVSFRSGSLALRGLVVRSEAGPARRPGIVVVSGSGAQGIATNFYAFWADYFASRGLVAMIYDKRGVGGSQGSWERASIPELAADAAAAFRHLRSRPDVDPGRVGMMGLSQGGWVVPLAAMSLPDAAFTILNVAPSVSVYEQELQRVEYSMRAADLPSSDIEEALRYTRSLLDAAKAGTGSESLTQDAARVGKKPWAEYVDLDVSPAGLEGWKALQYEPAPALRALRTPVLVLYGQRDTLVPPEENADRMRDTLTKGGSRDVTVTIIPGAQHNMELFGTLRNGKWHWPDSFWSWAHRSRAFYDTLDRWLAARNFVSTPGRAVSALRQQTRPQELDRHPQDLPGARVIVPIIEAVHPVRMVHERQRQVPFEGDRKKSRDGIVHARDLVAPGARDEHRKEGSARAQELFPDPKRSEREGKTRHRDRDSHASPSR